MDFKDYYAALGVSSDADNKTIKKAYQKLAKKYHPDVNPGDKAAEEKFKEATEAYEAIGEPEKRRKYDELRQDYQHWKNRGGRGNYNWERWQSDPRAGGGRHTRTMSPEEFAKMFGGSRGAGPAWRGADSFSEADFSDFFSTVFGMGGKPGRETIRRTRAGMDQEVEVQVTLEEAYHGTTRLIDTRRKQIEAKIPKGVRTGSKVRLAGQGGPGVAGGPDGNLYLNITVSPHAHFVRDEDNLRADLPVDFYKAVLGGEASVQTFSGEVMLKIPPLSQGGKKFRLKGKGMPSLESPSRYGDLFLELAIVLPENLSQQEITTLSELAAKRK